MSGKTVLLQEIPLSVNEILQSANFLRLLLDLSLECLIDFLDPLLSFPLLQFVISKQFLRFFDFLTQRLQL